MAVVYYTDKQIATVEVAKVEIPPEYYAEVDRIKNTQDSAGTDHNLWDEFLSPVKSNLDIALSSLRDALLDNVKGAWRLGVKDLTVETDEKLNIASGEELAVDNLTIKGRMRVKGVLDAFKDLNVIGHLDIIGEVNVGV